MIDDSLLIAAIILAILVAFMTGGPDHKFPPSEGHGVSFTYNAYK